MTSGTRSRAVIAGLRTRILVIIVVVTCVTAAVTGTAVTVVVRDWVYQDAQEAVLTSFRHDMQTFEDRQLANVPGGAEEMQRLRAQGYPAFSPEYTVEVDGRVFQRGSADPAEIPASMREYLERVPTMYRFQRTKDGRVLVGHSVKDPPEALGRSVVFYSAQPLGDVQARLNRLTLVVVTAVAGSALLGLLVALIVARTVTRPLRRVQDVASLVADGDTEARLPATKVTELRDLTASFNAMLDRQNESIDVLRRQDERSRRFVSDVSHELRSPLAALVPAAEVLREEAASLPAGSDLRRASELVADEADALSGLVDDLLEMTRLDAGVAEVRTERFELVGTLRDALAARGWSSVTVDGPPQLSVTTDRRRVVAVATNLVGNALRHGAEPVDVTVRESAGTVTIEVRDRGDGVPAEQAGQIFDRLYKAESARSRRSGGGAGLGLAIARDNARLLGGDVEYRREGAVTIFTARFTG